VSVLMRTADMTHAASSRIILKLNQNRHRTLKTTLLTRTLAALQGRVEMAVIEGDQQTSLDADRIRETGVPAIQINTGKGCHPEVGHALERLPLPEDGVLFHRERGEPGVSVLVRSR
jgi:hypothetical protein